MTRTPRKAASRASLIAELAAGLPSTTQTTKDALLKMKLTAPQGRRRAALALRPHCLFDHGPRHGGNARCWDQPERDPSRHVKRLVRVESGKSSLEHM